MQQKCDKMREFGTKFPVNLVECSRFPVGKDMLMSGSFGVLTTQSDGTKCYNKYNMFSMNVRRRLKVIPQWAKKFSLK